MNIKKKPFVFALLLALELVALIQASSYFAVIFGFIFVTIILAWVFNFEIKIKRENFLHNLRFIILPLLFNLGSAFFLAAFFQDAVKIILAILVGFVDYYLFWALKRVHIMGEKAAVFQRNVIISVAFISVFLSLSALFRFYVSLSIADDLKIPQVLVVALTALIFYLISHFLAWENGLDLKKFLPYNLVIALIGAETAWVTSMWIVNYPVFSSSEKANLGGAPLPALILTIMFYFAWGIVTHKADKSLTKNVMIEYIFLSLIFLFILILTARWLPQT